MFRSVVPLLLLAYLTLESTAGCSPGDTDHDTTPSGLDNYLSAGFWGGNEWRWKVLDNGMVNLQYHCYSGSTAEAVTVENSHLAFEVDLVNGSSSRRARGVGRGSIAANGRPGEEARETLHAVIDGVVSGNRIVFSATLDGQTRTYEVVAGVDDRTTCE